MTPPRQRPLEMAPVDSAGAKYREVNRAAVFSLILGSLSILLALSWAFVVLPILAVYLGRRALRQMNRSPELFTGESLAWTGMGLALVFFLAGGAWLMFVRAQEVPHGYQRVDMTELQPDPAVAMTADGKLVLPPEVLKLDGKKVYIKGYMIPTRQQLRLKQFFLCPTNGTCQYHPPKPRPTEIIRVKVVGDVIANYTPQPVGIGGILHVDPENPQKMPYSMEVDYMH